MSADRTRNRSQRWKQLLVAFALVIASLPVAFAQSDTIQTPKGPLKITPIYNSTLMLEFGGKVVYMDPVTVRRDGGQVIRGSTKTDYSRFSKADLILVSDIHAEHLDTAAIDQLKTPATIVVGPPEVAKTRPETQEMAYGDTKTLAGIEVEAVPMYNIYRGSAPGKLFHDRGRGNGYIVTLGGKRVYISADTECIPEMKALKNIDIAFLDVDAGVAMSPLEAAACAKAFRPKIVYPYHYGITDMKEFVDAMHGTRGIEVRLRKWY